MLVLHLSGPVLRVSKQLKAVVLCAFLHAACPAFVAEDLGAQARRIAQEMLLVDTHIDVPRLHESWADVSRSTDDGDFDHPRAFAGGLNVASMSIYPPGSKEAEGGGTQLAHRLIDSVETLTARAPGRYSMVLSTTEFEQLAPPGRLLLSLGMENGSPTAGMLDNPRAIHARRVRHMTLAHGVSNHISDWSYDARRPWGGLSPFGLEEVHEMNRLGIMIDVSHLSDAAESYVLEHSAVPVVATHSSARHFTPGWERNLSDELIKAIAAKGGVVHVNFGSGFLTAEAQEWWKAEDAATDAYLEAHAFAEESGAARAFRKRYLAGHPFPHASIGNVADHHDNIVGLVGNFHVGIGSDFDGVGDTLTIGLRSVADYPNLIDELSRRGYTETQLRNRSA